jgi:hypothetical protein
MMAISGKPTIEGPQPPALFGFSPNEILRRLACLEGSSSDTPRKEGDQVGS